VFASGLTSGPVSTLRSSSKTEGRWRNLISVKVTSNFSGSSLEREVMNNVMRQIQSRVRAVTCPVHGKTFPVTMRGSGLEVNEPCCEDGVEKAIEAAVEKALR
jgi:hypothetical protein